MTNARNVLLRTAGNVGTLSTERAETAPSSDTVVGENYVLRNRRILAGPLHGTRPRYFCSWGGPTRPAWAAAFRGTICPALMTLQSGTRLGPYEIQSALGAGGIGGGLSRARHAARSHGRDQGSAGGAGRRPAVPRAVRPRGARHLVARSSAHLHALRRWRAGLFDRLRAGGRVSRHAVPGRRDADGSDPET
jgi:hypothetical protein